MTTIHQLPQELLPEIFKYFPSYILAEIQHVCRAWYVPAHLLLLKEVELISSYHIEDFIASINQNTSSSYLAAVEKIKICSDDGFGVEYHFDKEAIDKLLCRFPNLMHVSIDSYLTCFEDFNEELCETIAENCPKLEYFQVFLDEEDEVMYCSTIYKLRSLVTGLYLDKVGSASEFGGTAKFITSFPRLKKVWGYHHRLNKFQDYFPIFEQLSNLKNITVTQVNYGGVEENFAERYLVRKSQEEQDLIIQKMSNVTDVTFAGDHIFCPRSIKFIANYFTGLNTLKITFNYNYRRWTDLHRQVLLGEMTSLKVTDHADITLDKMELAEVVECLPTIAHKVYSQLQNNRTLQIDVDTMYIDNDKINLRLQWPATKQLNVAFTKDYYAYTIMRTILSSQFTDFDRFVFHIRERAQYTGEIDINTFNIALKALPAIKEATLDIPTSFEDSIPPEELYQHTCLEKLTLRPTFNAKFESLLNTHAIMFPNIKQLNLFYYCGARKPDSRDFYVNLDTYTLERLVLDMNPVKRMMKEQSIESDFFMVSVETQEKKQRYRISMDLSSVTSADDEVSQDEVCVHILVKHLQSLEAHMYAMHNDYYGEYLDNSRNFYVKHTTIFK